MKNQELKDALVSVLSYLSQEVYYRVVGFSLLTGRLEDELYVLLENFDFAEGWLVSVRDLKGGGLELHTKGRGDGFELYAKENSTSLTGHFEDPFNPGDEELYLFKFLFPRDSDFIIAAGKELLKMEDKPNE